MKCEVNNPGLMCGKHNKACQRWERFSPHPNWVLPMFTCSTCTLVWQKATTAPKQFVSSQVWTHTKSMMDCLVFADWGRVSKTSSSIVRVKTLKNEDRVLWSSIFKTRSLCGDVSRPYSRCTWPPTGPSSAGNTDIPRSARVRECRSRAALRQAAEWVAAAGGYGDRHFPVFEIIYCWIV